VRHAGFQQQPRQQPLNRRGQPGAHRGAVAGLKAPQAAALASAFLPTRTTAVTDPCLPGCAPRTLAPQAMRSARAVNAPGWPQTPAGRADKLAAARQGGTR
jgi:hypothetical protein